RRAPLVRAPGACPAGGLVQVRADEPVDVAVQHPLGVAHLEASAVILDALVGMEEVAADLRAPLRRLLLAPFLGELPRALQLLPLQQPRAEDLHGGRLVLGLRALVL